jgi:PRC-barrel domain
LPTGFAANGYAERMSTPRSATSGGILVEDLKEWRGESVVDPADAKLGKLEDIYYDTETDLPAFAAVKSGVVGKRITLVPVAGATVGHSHVRVAVGKDDFKAAPSFDADAELTADDEIAIYGHFGIGYVPAGQDARRLAKH